MEKIYLKARAKINLTLNIISKREDGYHNLESIFQKINLYDELYIEKTDKEELELETNWQEIQNEDNIIEKAYKQIKEKYPQVKGMKVKLIKKIPMQAGLRRR